MRLSELHAKNFLCFRQFGFEPDEVNVITGVEGVGKTSLLRALDWLFTGSADTLTTSKGDFTEVVGADDQGRIDRIEVRQLRHFGERFQPDFQLLKPAQVD